MISLTYSLRPATLDDLPRCAAIVNDYVDETEWLPRVLSREETEALFNADLLTRRFVLVLEMDGQVGGYMSMNDAEARIIGLYLAPGFRCNGGGKALLNAAKARHPEGLTLTMFEPNLHARRFYEREGFEEVLEARNDNTE